MSGKPDLKGNAQNFCALRLLTPTLLRSSTLSSPAAERGLEIFTLNLLWLLTVILQGRRRNWWRGGRNQQCHLL